MSEQPVTWNEIPFNADASPEQKAYEFDAQVRENQQNPPPPAIDPQIKHG